MTILQRYNGMDTIATFQVWKVMEARLAQYPHAKYTYDYHKSLFSPLLYAMLRGILVDSAEVDRLRAQFDAECRHLEEVGDAITRPLGMGRINFASGAQVIWAIETLSGEVPVKRKKGKPPGKSADRASLEAIAKSDPELSPFINIILAWRDRKKMLDVLQPELRDADDRMRCTYKIGGTVTFRLSSSKNCLWTGMNMQNIKRDEDEEATGHASIRSMFIADKGKKFVNVDLKGADSWAVALEVFKYTGDRSYLDACQSKDLHTFVCKLVWKNLGWTGDWGKDKKIASQFFYRQYDYRFMAKKGGHGSNYLGKPFTLATQMKIPVGTATNFQHHYFRAFPGIPKWHAIRARDLQENGFLVNLFGHRRGFHDRLDSDATLREAIAFLGQSVTACSINRAILNIWRAQLQMPWLGLEFLAQVHDSTLKQFYEQAEAEVLDLLPHLMHIPITVTSPKGETITVSIPLEIKVGWNWAAESPSNPDGLRELKPGQTDDRTRTSQPPQTQAGFMDKRLSGLHRRSLQPETVP